VIVQTLAGQTTPLMVDLVAEVKAYREVDIYPRISGQLIRQSFKPGQKVKEGELLFSIDPRAYDEAIIDAQAKLAEAESVLARARQDVARYKPLLPDNAIPRQTYDQAVAYEQQNTAVAQARRAGLERPDWIARMPMSAHRFPARSDYRKLKSVPWPPPARRCSPRCRHWTPSLPISAFPKSTTSISPSDSRPRNAKARRRSS
jgi:multidrug efflux pump subunit AcrA (membrane-fusion protein)